MNDLFMIFDEDIIREGNEVYKETNEKYEKIDKIIDSGNLPKHGYGLYYFYPYLFKDEFKSVEKEKFSLIAQSGIFCLENLIYFDRLVDSQIKFDINNFLQKNFLMNYSTKLLAYLFDFEDKFWEYYEKYYKEYIRAIKIETEKHYNKIIPFDYLEYKDIARGKSALSKYPATALAFISDRKDKIAEMEEAQDIFAEAFQLYDDLRDWKEDFELKHFSWLLTKVLSENNLSSDCKKEEVSEALFRGGYDIMVLEKINELCEKAMTCSIKSKSWIRYIRYFQSKSNNLMFDFYTIRKVEIPNSIFGDVYNKKIINDIYDYKIEETINCALKFIINQHKNGYPELTHWMMYLRKNDGPKEECIEGDIFWRAITFNLLLDVKDMGYEIPENLIFDNLNFLNGKKSIYHTYGWSYCCNIQELPPDLDTLSEIIKISARFSNVMMSNAVKDSIHKALRYAYKFDGSFGTYIIDNNDSSEINLSASKAVNEIYGDAPSIEVNANFIHALATFDYHLNKILIDECIEWITDNQNSEGYWESSYYLGNYYCGYIYAKIYKKLGINKAAAEKNCDYITLSQNSNGSWGTNGGNPQDTAFAISALVDYCSIKKEKCNESIRKGILYLRRTINDEYNWTGCEFLAFGKGRHVASRQMMRYRSTTLTTVICIYSLIKGNLLLKNNKIIR